MIWLIIPGIVALALLRGRKIGCVKNDGYCTERNVFGCSGCNKCGVY